MPSMIRSLSSAVELHHCPHCYLNPSLLAFLSVPETIPFLPRLSGIHQKHLRTLPWVCWLEAELPSKVQVWVTG